MSQQIEAFGERLPADSPRSFCRRWIARNGPPGARTDGSTADLQAAVSEAWPELAELDLVEFHRQYARPAKKDVVEGVMGS